VHNYFVFNCKIFVIKYFKRREFNLRKLKIPQNHSGISKTLRLPENLVNDISILSDLKNISFNKTVIELLEFSLENLDSDDEKFIKQKRQELYS